MLKKLLMLICVLLLTSSSSIAAEFLIQATHSYWETVDTVGWTDEMKAKMVRQERYGAFGRVEDDGFVWGRMENPDTSWLLLRIPSLNYLTVLNFLDAHTDSTGTILFNRDYYIPEATMDQFLIDAADSMRIDVSNSEYNKLRNAVRKRSED